MIQDIAPKVLDNAYHPYEPQDEDTVFFFEGSSILSKIVGENVQGEQQILEYPLYKDYKKVSDMEYKYLFSIDEKRYFIAFRSGELQKGEFVGEMADSKVHKEYETLIDGFEFVGVDSFRKAAPKEEAFAAITAFHLNSWYRDNKFCGRCGAPTVHDSNQRMVKCSKCGNMIFPKICPAVIVAVTNKDKILLTKYAGRTYRNYALIAGYTEIGETVEETVKREVLEEVGLKVKNITYYKSQPWALSGTLLMGYFCELDGDDSITLDDQELALGTWVSADEIDFEDDGISLTREMILKFAKDYRK